MAITFITAGTWAQGTTSITPSMPTGASGNDLCILVVECQSSETPNVATSGWNLVGRVTESLGTYTTKLSVWYAWQTTAGISAPTASATTDHVAGQIVAFRNVDMTTPFEASGTATASATATAYSFPTLTTVSPNAMVVNIASEGYDASGTTNIGNWVNSSLTSITEGLDRATNTGNGGGYALAYGLKATAGSVPATTASATNATSKAMYTLALREVFRPSITESVTASAVPTATLTGPDPVTASVDGSAHVGESVTVTRTDAVPDLNASATDGVAVGEGPQEYGETHYVTEQVTLQVVSSISVADSIGVADLPFVSGDDVWVSESVTVNVVEGGGETEFEVEILNENISVGEQRIVSPIINEPVGVTDAPTVSIANHVVSITETVQAGEARIISPITNEGVTVTESPTVTLANHVVSVSETVQVGEARIVSPIVNEPVTVGELPTVSIANHVLSVTEAIQVGEARIVSPIVNEPVTLGELPTVTIANHVVSVGETINVGESVLIAPWVNEPVTVQEQVTVFMPGSGVLVTESVSVGEGPAEYGGTVHVAESVTAEVTTPIHPVESIAVTESLADYGNTVGVRESVTVAVVETSVTPLSVSVTETVGVVEGDDGENVWVNEDVTVEVAFGQFTVSIHESIAAWEGPEGECITVDEQVWVVKPADAATMQTTFVLAGTAQVGYSLAGTNQTGYTLAGTNQTGYTLAGTDQLGYTLED